MPAFPQMVSLRCGAVMFALPIEAVREIVMVPEITPVPDTSPFVRGIINLRGRILPVLDLALRLGFGRGPSHPDGRILIVEPDRDHPLGLLVDEASEVLRVPDELLSPPPELAARGASGAVRSVAKLEDRLLLVLDLARVVSSAEQSLSPVLADPVLGAQ
jgi:purine-binding chemotaxis protein CheW